MLGRGKKKLWFRENLPQSCQFDIISVRPSCRNLTTLWTLDWHYFLDNDRIIYEHLMPGKIWKMTHVMVSALFASCENFTGATLFTAHLCDSGSCFYNVLEEIYISFCLCLSLSLSLSIRVFSLNFWWGDSKFLVPIGDRRGGSWMGGICEKNPTEAKTAHLMQN